MVTILDSLFQLTEAQLSSIEQCEKELGYVFQNKQYLYHAITHASVANSRLHSYERLEFLGDSILGFVVCELLFSRYDNWLEGELTKVKSNVVSRQSCAEIGEAMRLGDFLIVGKGVGLKGKVPKSLLANVFESIVAAIYLDGGLDKVKEFLIPIMEKQVEASIQGDLEINYKSELQQYAQKRFGMPPHYRLLDDRGPDHDKWFKVSAQVSKKEYLPAWGKNKKEAEQRAAANALAEIQGEDAPYDSDDTILD